MYESSTGASYQVAETAGNIASRECRRAADDALTGWRARLSRGLTSALLAG
jgi:hypothetical protein